MNFPLICLLVSAALSPTATFALEVVSIDEPYVVDEMNTDSFKKDFATEECGLKVPLAKWTAKQKKDCDTKFKEVQLARLQLKYPAADFQKADLTCRAHPKQCKEGNTYESWLRATHNERAETEEGSRHSEEAAYNRQVAAQGEANRAARIQNVSNALMNFSNAIAPRPVAPMQRIQPMNRQCRTRYDGYGALVTECFP